jgi:cell wall-associated NlpC family hydrolase
MLRYLFILFYLFAGIHASSASHRSCIIEKAQAEVGVREATGKNDGTKVEAYLKTTGLGKGYAWCAAFVNYVLKGCGIKTPDTAWSPSWFPQSKLIYKKGSVNKREWQPGDVFGIYFQNLKRIGHVGLIKKRGSRMVATIEGNTNDALSRDGDGVYEKWRLNSQIYVVSDWIGGE